MSCVVDIISYVIQGHISIRVNLRKLHHKLFKSGSRDIHLWCDSYPSRKVFQQCHRRPSRVYVGLDHHLLKRNNRWQPWISSTNNFIDRDSLSFSEIKPDLSKKKLIKKRSTLKRYRYHTMLPWSVPVLTNMPLDHIRNTSI